MHIVYTERASGFAPGHAYRNPRYFEGVERGAKQVTIEGEHPDIEAAYRAAKVEVIGAGNQRREPAPKAAEQQHDALRTHDDDQDEQPRTRKAKP